MADNKSLSYLMDIDKNNKAEFSEIKSKIDNIDNKVTPVQEDMAQLVENVQKQVNELRTIVENSPAGVPAPWLESITSQSQEDGINVTYRAKFLQGRVNSTENWLFAQTRGVMVRYSSERFPMNINEGYLGFIDEDLFEVDENGVVAAKTKNNVIVGLTTNTKYYISAFPYSTNNVYNETLNQNNGKYTNLNNTTSCTWSGTKGTLNINVTQDYDYKPLGEYTATMTPTAGGQAITKTQSGAATVVFSGLEAGEYTLSFNAPQYFTAPQNQSVTVVAGQSQTVEKVFEFTPTFAELSFEDLSYIAKTGKANEFFSIGNKRTEKIKYITHNKESSGSTSDPYKNITTQDVSVELVIIGINKDVDVNGNSNTITLMTKDAVCNFSSQITFMNSRPDLYVYTGWRNTDGLSESSTTFPYFREYLNNNYNIILGNTISPYIRKIKLSTESKLVNSDTSFTRQHANTEDFLFPPSSKEIGSTSIFSQGESSTYPYFTNDSSRIIKDNKTKSPVLWCTRTSLYSSKYGWGEWYKVDYDGTIDNSQQFTGEIGTLSYNQCYFPLCFCV